MLRILVVTMLLTLSGARRFRYRATFFQSFFAPAAAATMRSAAVVAVRLAFLRSISPERLAIDFLNHLFLVKPVHASILRLGSGLSTNGKYSTISTTDPFTLSLSKPVLSLSKGANALHSKKDHYIERVAELGRKSERFSPWRG
jgi:hypothetical protein